MKCSITLSLVPEARGGPFVFWDDLEAACREAAMLRFDAIEIFPPSGAAVRALDLGEILPRHGLALAALGTGAGWVKHNLSLSSPDLANRQHAITFVKELIDAAAGMGSAVIIGSMQGRADSPGNRHEAVQHLGESLRQLGSYAATHQVTLLYEFLNRYETNLFNRVEDVVPFIQRLDCPALKVLADLFHMNIEEASIPQALRQLGPLLGHVHFVDSNRRAPGFGHTDFSAVIAALREINYTGYLSAEALPWPEPLAAAAQTIGQFQELTAQAPALPGTPSALSPR